MEFEIKDKNKITEEDKIAVCKKYKDVIKLVYEIFDGQIFRKDLKKLCIKYHYCSESTFDIMLKILCHYSIFKIVNIASTDFDVVAVMNFAIQRIEKKKKVKSIDVCETKLLVSQFKFHYIDTHIVYNAENNINKVTLAVLRKNLIKYSTLHIKENKAILTDEWIESTFSTNTEKMEELKEKSRKFEKNRVNRLKKEEETEDEIKDNSENVIVLNDKIQAFEEKLKFTTIRSKTGFIDVSSYQSQPINNTVELAFFNTTLDFRDYYNRAKDVVEMFYLYTEFLNDIEKININLYFRDIEQKDKSFDNCTMFAKLSNGKVIDERQLFHAITKISKSKLQYAPNLKDITINKNTNIIEFKYVKDIKNSEAKEIAFKISFKAFDIYKDFYNTDKATAMIQMKEEEKAKKRAKKKELDDTVKELTKIRVNNSLDNLELLCSLSPSELNSLIYIAKNIKSSKLHKLVEVLNDL